MDNSPNVNFKTHFWSNMRQFSKSWIGYAIRGQTECAFSDYTESDIS